MTGAEALMAIQFMGAAVGAMSAISAGNAAAAEGKHNARVNEYNAKVSENSAVAARQTAAENKRRFDKQTAIRMGSIRARGGSHLSLDFLESSAAEEELEAQGILHAGETEAQSFEQKATLFRQAGRLRLAQGAAAQTAGTFGATGALITGGVKANASLPAGHALKIG